MKTVFVSIDTCHREGNPVELSRLAMRWGNGQTIIVDSKSVNVDKSVFNQETLCITHNVTLLINGLKQINWPIPENLIDLGIEARNLRNGLIENDEASLEKAIECLGIKPTNNESLLVNVTGLELVYNNIKDKISLKHALFRGEYCKALAEVENTGIPIDIDRYRLLMKKRIAIRRVLIDRVDRDFGVYKNYAFNESLFADYLRKHKLSWPITESGKYKIDDETFKQMCSIYPQVKPLRELRKLLNNLKNNKLTIGDNGRNRTLMIPFKAKTGRNQPKSSKYIMGQSKVLRCLIKPPPGKALAYIDWSQQEFGIAAALSGDENMMKVYSDGDPYLAFAKLTNAVPADATKQSHPDIRSVFKECILAVQYGMGPKSLAQRIKRNEDYARWLLDCHKRMFPKFWDWLDDRLNFVMFNSYLRTRLDWRIHISGLTDINERSLGNFTIQATAAEILRLATIEIVSAGIKVCTTVFDAFLIEAPINRIDAEIQHVKALMEQSGAQLLNGFQLRSDVSIFRYPDSYHDSDEMGFWSLINPLLNNDVIPDPRESHGPTPLKVT